MRDTDPGTAWADTFTAVDLAGLGWARAARSAPAELIAAHPTAAPARVVRVDRGRMLLVATGDGSLHHVHDRATRSSADLLDDGPPVVGDWVLVERPPDGTPASVGMHARARLPRVGVLARRRDTSSTAPQVLAANVDLVLVAEALEPDRSINVARVARFVAIATAGDVDVCVLLTGADRLDSHDDLPREVAGVPAIATSIVDGRGLDALRELLAPGVTATIVGASGAGKSSIANALLDVELLAVGARRTSGTGRHTTSTSRLVPIPGGALLVDTPGIRSVGMHAGVDAQALESSALGTFAERCRFTDCHHDGEPGCAVEAAIEAGDLPADSIAAWRKLEREARRERARVDDRLRRELAAEHKAFGRDVVRARRRGEIQERRR